MAASDCPLPGLSSSSQADRGFVFGTREIAIQEEAYLMNGMSLAKEERLYKKLRSKKITKEEYDKLMYGGDEGSEAEDGDSD